MDFIDLKQQYQLLRDPIRARIDAVLEHGHYIMGPEVTELENKLADSVGARYAVTCGSGTEALLMPLMAWGIGPGDAVFVPSFTFFATAEVVGLTGATPIFVDVDPFTFTMDAEQLVKAIQAVLHREPDRHPIPRQAWEQQLTPRAVIPVDLFGVAAEYQTLLPLAKRYNLLVLEDGAQAFGGHWLDKAVCGLGAQASATSFFPAKTLGCYGDGGAVFTDDEELASVLRSIRVHGKGKHKYDNVRLGINGRLDTLQAAILLPKLEILADEITSRQAVAQRYTANLSTIPGVAPPRVPAYCKSAFAQYSVLFDDSTLRDHVASFLQSKSIPTAIYYVKPLHLQFVFADLGYTPGDLPISEDLSSRILSLPMHPYLSEASIDRVCDGIHDALSAAVI